MLATSPPESVLFAQEWFVRLLREAGFHRAASELEGRPLDYPEVRRLNALAPIVPGRERPFPSEGVRRLLQSFVPETTLDPIMVTVLGLETEALIENERPMLGGPE